MGRQKSVNGWNNGHLVQFAMIGRSKPRPFTILINGYLYVGLAYGLFSVNLGDFILGPISMARLLECFYVLELLLLQSQSLSQETHCSTPSVALFIKDACG